MAPSGAISGSEKRESNASASAAAEIHSSLPSSNSPPAATIVTSSSSAATAGSKPATATQLYSGGSSLNATVKTEPGVGGVQSGGSGKRYCCYVGNMTWWATDEQLTVTLLFLTR